MIQIEFKSGGKELAKILHYYGLLEGDSEFKIVCPFHEDVNPSMLVNLVDGNFKCFGCETSGDAIKFVKLMNPKMNDLEAMMEYYKILKSNKVKQFKYVKHARKTKKEDVQALVEADDYYSGLKQTNWLKEKSDVKQYMVKRGFAAKTLNKCKAKFNYNDSYPIILPMFDMHVFKGWVCRTTNPEIEKKRKYLYNEGFSRRTTLVGTYNNETVVVVEGYMDWLKMKQNGVKYVCALLGWKATTEQIAKLRKQGVKHIISALDNDKCGNKGTAYLKSLGHFEVTRFQFPEGVKDPGEMDLETFRIANNKTKKIFRRKKSNGINGRHQKPSKESRQQQGQNRILQTRSKSKNKVPNRNGRRNESAISR